MVCVTVIPLQNLLKLGSMIPNMYIQYIHNIYIIYIYIPNSQVVLLAHLKHRTNFILLLQATAQSCPMHDGYANQCEQRFASSKLPSFKLHFITSSNPRIYLFMSCFFEIKYLQSLNVHIYTSLHQRKIPPKTSPPDPCWWRNPLWMLHWWSRTKSHRPKKKAHLIDSTRKTDVANPPTQTAGLS